MTTWLDIKIKALQKCFVQTNGNIIPSDTSTREYIDSMPGAANEALQLLATAGKFITKSVKIAHNPVRNLLSGTDHINRMERGEMVYEADGARSLFLEYFGEGVLSVLVNGNEIIHETLESPSAYSEFRALIDNPTDAHVVMKITSEYPFAVKNVALYSANFKTTEDIQSYAEKIRYKMRELCPDFYMLDGDNIYFEGDSNDARYLQTQNFFQEGNTVLVLDRNLPGNYTIYYKAYPQEITSQTTDDTVLSIDPEVAALMPLYIASQLYKEDDNGIATQYRNEFESAFSRLRDSVNTPSAERFTSESGWI